MADEQGAIPEALERLQDAANRKLGFRRGIIKNDRVVVTRADLQWLLDRFPDCDPDAPAADRLTDTGEGAAYWQGYDDGKRAALATPKPPVDAGAMRERERIIAEAQKCLRLTQGCMECNAEDERRWMDTIQWLESLA